MTRLHIVHCAAYGGPYEGSFVPMLVAAATEARRRGHRTTVCLPDFTRGSSWLQTLRGVAEVTFIAPAGGRMTTTVATMNTLRALVRDDDRAVIHTHFGYFDIPAALTRVWEPATTVFWHEHTVLRGDRRTRIRNTLRCTCFGPVTSRVLCVSPEIRRALRARGMPGRKLQDFPNAVDLARFAPVTNDERTAARQALDLAEHAQVVLHFGWLWRLKGGDLMLAAADMLKRRGEVVVLTVVGEDALQEAGLALSRHRLVRRLPPTNDVRQLYAAADVFLSTSRAEGMPFAVLEALACGLPVVAADLPVLRELLAGLPGATTVDPEPISIAAALETMLSLSGDDRAAHARLSRIRIESRFALGPWARRLVDLYERCTAFCAVAGQETAQDVSGDGAGAGT